MKYIASFSGGKDSAAMVLMILEKGLPLDEIVFIDTGLEFASLYKYIKIFERKTGFPITWLKPEKTFFDYFYTKKKSGENKGQIYGWPFTQGFSWCNDRLKQRTFNAYLKQQTEECTVYIGIAADEPKRIKKLKKNRRAPLVEFGITEAQAQEYLKEKGYFNLLYWTFERLGCYLCPKQSLKSLRAVRRHYPFLWEKMLKLDKDSPIPFKADGTTVHDLERRFAYEDSISTEEPWPIVEKDLFLERQVVMLIPHCCTKCNLTRQE